MRRQCLLQESRATSVEVGGAAGNPSHTAADTGRGAKGREFAADGESAASGARDAPPDLSSIPPLPGNRRVDEFKKSRSAERPGVWICGRDLAGVNHVGAGSCQLGDAEGIRTCCAAHGGSVSWQSHGCPHRRSRRQAKVSKEGIKKIDLRRGVVQGARPGVDSGASEVGEALHPGPALRPLLSARLQALQVPPTVVDSPPPSSVLDALEFDLTIEDSESEVDGCEPVAIHCPTS